MKPGAAARANSESIVFAYIRTNAPRRIHRGDASATFRLTRYSTRNAIGNSQTCLVRMERPAPDLQHRGLRCESGETRRRAACKWEPAMRNVRFVGLDVHAETIAVAVAEPRCEPWGQSQPPRV